MLPILITIEYVSCYGCERQENVKDQVLEVLFAKMVFSCCGTKSE